MRTIQQIQADIGVKSIPPPMLKDYKAELAHHYSTLTDKLEDILIHKPEVWSELRSKQKSDAATDRAWEGTDVGKQEIQVRLRLKKVEKLISAVNSLIRVAEQEAQNLY